MNQPQTAQRTEIPEAPSSSWTLINVKGVGTMAAVGEFWRARDLLRMLIMRHLKIRFAQTAMGALWVVLQPLMTALIFSVLFGVFVKVPSEGIPYVVYAYPAMILWSVFAQSFERGSASLMIEERLITKVYFPRLVIPISASLSTLADFIISTILLLPICLFFGIRPSPLSIFAFIGLPPVVILSSALGIITASLSIRYRDLRQVAPFVTQLWFYATPVVYPLTVVPEGLRTAVLCNPVSAPVLWFRASVIGTAFPPLWSMVASYGTSFAVLALAIVIFRNVERGMADWL